MYRLLVFLTLLFHGPTAVAGGDNATTDIEVDTTNLAWSIERGRIQWRFEALDLLPLPVFEPFGGVALGEQMLLAQDLANLSFEPEDERQFVLSITIGW